MQIMVSTVYRATDSIVFDRQTNPHTNKHSVEKQASKQASQRAFLKHIIKQYALKFHVVCIKAVTMATHDVKYVMSDTTREAA